jgi:hypothetical protein
MTCNACNRAKPINPAELSDAEFFITLGRWRISLAKSAGR